MHPLIGRRGGLWLYLAAWLPLGGLVVALLVATAGISPLEALVLGLPLVAVFSQIALSAWYVCRVTPIAVDDAGAAVRPALILLAAAAVSSALWVLVGGGWAATLERLPAFTGAAARYRGAAPLLFGLGVLLYLLAAAGHYLALSLTASRDAERRAFEVRVLAREAELRALKAQVDPHFLFNSLNAVAALAGRDAAAARRMALMLADFLRRSLRLADRGTIPLAEELALVRAYLAIEQVRFGDRLAVEERIDPAVGAVEVPPLILQPLVENAIKHGIAGLVGGGTVAIEGRRRGAASGVVLAVTNDRDPEAGVEGTGGAVAPGIGLANVRRRLVALYGDDARLQLTVDPGRFRAEVRLPAPVRGEPS